MKRHIVTQYNQGDEVLKVNRSVHPPRAIANCVARLQTDEYNAAYAQVWDERTGALWAIFTRTPSKITILYKRKVPKEKVK